MMEHREAVIMNQTKKTVSIVLKLIVIISAAAGVYLSWQSGKNSFMGGSRVFMFFTIQSNIAAAIVCAMDLWTMGKEHPGTIWPLVRFVTAVSITLTGMVFCFVLAPTLGKYAWNLQNVLTHVVVPLGAVADFFVTGTPSFIRKSSVIYVTLPPLAYALYAGIAYVMKWEFFDGVYYPYFFLNWGSPCGAFGFSSELPFMGCVWWILALLIFLIAVGRLYLFLPDLLKRKSEK